MIGLGRAVGETMIVLMATGNTPIMEANIFEGLRTLAANVAVEMPESEVGGTHYRVLFLAALVLLDVHLRDEHPGRAGTPASARQVRLALRLGKVDVREQNNLKTWFKSGCAWIWMNAGAVSIAGDHDPGLC